MNSQNFATAAAIQVSGAVTVNGSVQVGVALNASNGGSCTATNASGVYTCAVPSGWSGTVTPVYPNGVFTPASRSYTNVTTAQASQDYAGTVTYQISGTVTLNGLGLPNVAFAATNGGSCSNSNTSGVYSCTVSVNWTGTVTPSASGYSFSPTSRSYTNVTANQGSQTYAATLGTATAPIYFVHADHLNTPRAVFDANQQLRWKWEQQEPFGVNVPDENPNSLGVFEYNPRYPGQYFDKETNQVYNYFRDCYDPALGRYCQSDPIGLEGGLNTYLYVRANPTKYTDSLGLREVDPSSFDGGSGGGGGVASGSFGPPGAAVSISGPSNFITPGQRPGNFITPEDVAAGVGIMAGSYLMVPAAMAVPGACVAIGRSLMIKDPCKNPIIAATLGMAICRGDPPDEFLQDVQRRETIRAQSGQRQGGRGTEVQSR